MRIIYLLFINLLSSFAAHISLKLNSGRVNCSFSESPGNFILIRESAIEGKPSGSSWEHFPFISGSSCGLTSVLSHATSLGDRSLKFEIKNAVVFWLASDICWWEYLSLIVIWLSLNHIHLLRVEWLGLGAFVLGHGHIVVVEDLLVIYVFVHAIFKLGVA